MSCIFNYFVCIYAQSLKINMYGSNVFRHHPVILSEGDVTKWRCEIYHYWVLYLDYSKKKNYIHIFPGSSAESFSCQEYGSGPRCGYIGRISQADPHDFNGMARNDQQGFISRSEYVKYSSNSVCKVDNVLIRGPHLGILVLLGPFRSRGTGIAQIVQVVSC